MLKRLAKKPMGSRGAAPGGEAGCVVQDSRRGAMPGYGIGCTSKIANNRARTDRCVLVGEQKNSRGDEAILREPDFYSTCPKGGLTDHRRGQRVLGAYRAAAA